MSEYNVNKYKYCDSCIYHNDKVFEIDCKNCDENKESHYVSYELFNSDMDMYNEGEFYGLKEEKIIYFPIRWLIRLIMKYESEYCCIWFNRIVFYPKGNKQENDSLPIWLKLFFPFVYIWQFRNGGYSGDDYAGNIYYRLFPFIWLEFGYEC